MRDQEELGEIARFTRHDTPDVIGRHHPEADDVGEQHVPQRGRIRIARKPVQQRDPKKRPTKQPKQRDKLRRRISRHRADTELEWE